MTLSIFEIIILVGVIFSSINVLFVHNPVQSLLWLILSFILFIMELLILGIEFVALLFLMIYIGAIAVLFLFVIMMLNIRIIELDTSHLKYFPIGGLFFIFFFILIYFFLYLEFEVFSIEISYKYFEWINFIVLKGNIYLLGNIIYTYYSIYFCLLSIILLIAMMGSIILIMYFEKRDKKDEHLFTNINVLKYYKMQ